MGKRKKPQIGPDPGPVDFHLPIVWRFLFLWFEEDKKGQLLVSVTKGTDNHGEVIRLRVCMRAVPQKYIETVITKELLYHANPEHVEKYLREKLKNAITKLTL